MQIDDFSVFFKCFTDEEGNKVGKGSLDEAYTSALYAEQVYHISVEDICKKWQQYINYCIANKTADQYIMGMKNFIDKGRYKEDFGGSLKTAQSSFLDKYVGEEAPMKEVTNETTAEKKVAQYIINMEEGEFTLEGQSPEDCAFTKKVIQKEKLNFFQNHNFVIKADKQDQNLFTKIKL